MRTPSDDALSAMPGDTIYFLNEMNVIEKGVVKAALWTETPKGGKVWTYELFNEQLVPNLKVGKVEKSFVNNTGAITQEADEFTQVIENGLIQGLLSHIEDLNMPSIVKAAMFCMVLGDEKNLEVAKFLIEKRLDQISELTALKGL